MKCKIKGKFEELNKILDIAIACSCKSNISFSFSLWRLVEGTRKTVLSRVVSRGLSRPLLSFAFLPRMSNTQFINGPIYCSLRYP